ncbi:hypothetical protein CEXT_727831, partial [Caerostris extrusa]
ILFDVYKLKNCPHLLKFFITKTTLL